MVNSIPYWVFAWNHAHPLLGVCRISCVQSCVAKLTWHRQAKNLPVQESVQGDWPSYYQWSWWNLTSFLVRFWFFFGRWHKHEMTPKLTPLTLTANHFKGLARHQLWSLHQFMLSWSTCTLQRQSPCRQRDLIESNVMMAWWFGLQTENEQPMSKSIYCILKAVTFLP